MQEHNKWMGEKEAQMTAELYCFGVKITSRYGKFTEISEMMMFCSLLAQFNVEHLIKSAFYDSQAQLCNFDFSREIDRTERSIIKHCAESSISQYEYDGACYGVDYVSA